MKRIVGIILSLLILLNLHAQRREELLSFLLDNMSLPDRSSYDEKFFLDNIDITLQARNEMPWGKDVPEDVFRHFVLPLRVNNESLDSFRVVYYDVLKDRVKGLSMEDALLEVNHWCHEKVTYQPSDSRTSSPLSSISQAIGRCGEESTFTVAAMRAVGIPARQVYTPRWAHTDDNHAWVEAWANGKWYFLGACEPEAILNLGWFNAPASRGMLMSTNVFGDYYGPEEVLNRNGVTTTINVTSNYAPVETLKVRVLDAHGHIVPGATVGFCVYNYAEFYPVAKKITDDSGNAELNVGLGDLLVWATDGKSYGFAQGNPQVNDIVNVVLDKDEYYRGNFEFKIVPPRQSNDIVQPTLAQQQENNLRLALEDSIRNAYIKTFATPEMAAQLGAELKVDEQRLIDLLVKSRGNHVALVGFLSKLSPCDRVKTIDLLSVISEKDLRDIPIDVLNDHLFNSPSNPDSTLFVQALLNPRIENEQLTPYKGYFQKEIDKEHVDSFILNPRSLFDWVKQNVIVDEASNPQRLRMDPRAVWRERVTDARSRDIFAVALARSMGVPARMDLVTGTVQYFDTIGQWKDYYFESHYDDVSKGKISFDYTPTPNLKNPVYYSNFSLVRIKDGWPSQLEFDESATVQDLNALEKQFDEGNYALITGTRMADGSVSVAMDIFRLIPDTLNVIPLRVISDSTAIEVIGSFDSEKRFLDADGKEKSILSKVGRGYYVLGLIRPSNEPTMHVLKEFIELNDDIENSGVNFLLLFDSANELNRFDFSAVDGLPSNIMFGIDSTGDISKDITDRFELIDSQRPVFIVADSFNRVVYVHQGYQIGVGQQILKLLENL